MPTHACTPFETLKVAFLNGEDVLYLLEPLKDDIARCSIPQRIELATACLDAPTLDRFQRIDRAKIALGKLNYGSQESCGMWWSDLFGRERLIPLAIEQGLHMRYFTPTRAMEVLSPWVGASASMPEPALLVWDKGISGHSRPYLLPALMESDYFSDQHEQLWGERIMDTWEQAPHDARFTVIDGLLKDASPNALKDPTRKKWMLHWCRKFLEKEAFPTMFICEFMGKRDEKFYPLDPDIMGLAASMEDGQVLQAQTVSSSPSPRNRI